MRRTHRLALGLGSALSLGVVVGPIGATESITYTYDALGRLVVAQSAGTANDDQTHSMCFDAAGNRTKYRADDAGAVPTCAPTPSAMPSPVAPTSSSNTPPTAVTDTVKLKNYETKVVDLIANDTDSDGDLPLVLTSASVTSGPCTITLVSVTQASAYRGAGSTSDPQCVIAYGVTDARGATSTGQLDVNK